MSALTKKERDGLDDVFLSIHSNNNKYLKMKELSALILSPNLNFSMRTLLKRAKRRLKKSKLSYYFMYSGKKKKNLSK